MISNDWNDHIGAIARNCALEARFNRQQVLPPTRDVVKLKDFCEDQLPRLCDDFSQSPSAESFGQLAAVTLCRLIAFKNRQPEEPAKLIVEKYTLATWC